MACVSENSGDDGRYLNSDHPGWKSELLSATPEVLKLRQPPKGSILLSVEGFSDAKAALFVFRRRVFDRKEFRDQVIDLE